MAKVVELVFENAGDITATILLVFICLGLGYVVYAFAFGKLPTPGEHKKLVSRCDDTDNALVLMTKELGDARILVAESKIRLQFLEAQIASLKNDNDTLRTRITRLETEVDVRRADEWRQSRQGKGE